MVPQAQVLVPEAQGEQPLVAEGAPVLEPLQIGARLAEKLQLHLFKLTDPEDEVARRNLITEALANLSDAEGQLLPGGTLHVGEVDKNALGGLGPEIDGVLAVLGDALEGLEHQVELTDVGKIVLAAGGAGDVVLLNEVLHLLLGKGVDGLGQLKAVLGAPVLNEFVGAEALVALPAVHQRVGKTAQVAGGHPGLGVHEDGGVQAHVVGVLLHELLPPGALDVVLQLRAQGTIVPGIGETAVDLAAGKDKAPAFAQGHQFFH